MIPVPEDIKNITVKRVWWLPSKMYGLHRHYLHFLPLELLMPVKADAMVFSDFGCPTTIQKVPKLAVIHDLAYKIHPEYVVAKHAQFLDKLVKHTLKNASRVIAISESTKKDLIEEYQYDAGKIDIISPAVDGNFYKPANDKEVAIVKQKYGIDGDYILFLSTLEPRKNVASIIKAYDLLAPELRAKYKLVLAGKKGWLDDEIEALCEKMGEQVIRTGRVETSEKPALYSDASVFAFPSAYEGFGIPILEAMACGTPVITSNVSSMPEVASDAAIIVDPHNTHDIVEALTKVLTDAELAKQLKRDGLQRAKEFTWQKSGEKLATLLRRVTKN
jgi:glycosyltransferase involved in cell wall biosynthesis